jgi:hypothetical protein
MVLFLFAALSLAKDEEFLLGDLGVRIDPAGWKMDRWSDWDFRATSSDGTVVLAAWATPLQVELGEPAAWSPVIEAKLVEFGAREPTRASGSVESGTNPSVRQEFGFSFPDGARGTAYAATLAIAGSNLHLATFTRAATAGRARSLLASTVERLELRKPPLPAPPGALQVAGHTLGVPPGFRDPLESEVDTVLAAANAIGGDDLSACDWVFRPEPAVAPTVLLACPSRQHFGVLDELTLDDVAADLAPRLFGKAEPPPAELVTLPDRNGLRWKLPSAGKGVRMALVPAGATAVKVTVAAPADDPRLDEDLAAALRAATWAEPHVVPWTENVGYWTSYRPFSPQVLCPLLGVSCPVGALALGVGALMLRRKPSTPD